MNEVCDRDNIPKGTIISNYKFIDHIGSGGFADCYTVTSINFQMLFAAKVIHATGSSKEQGDDYTDDKMVSTPSNYSSPRDTISTSIETEILALKNLDNEHIIRLYDHFVIAKGHYCLILEYCSNGTVTDEVMRNGPLRGDRLFTVARQVIQAIAYSHSMGVAHRDIKPSNILFDSFGRAKIADFGIASMSHELTDHFQCSLPYASPEIINKKKYDVFLSDIWSLGITLLFMATGELPYPAETNQDLEKAISVGNVLIPPDLPQEFTNIVKMMLKFDPKKRAPLSEIVKLDFFKVTIPCAKRFLNKRTISCRQSFTKPVKRSTSTDNNAKKWRKVPSNPTLTFSCICPPECICT